MGTKKERVVNSLEGFTKTQLAHLLGVSRATLYYTSILEHKDILLRDEILEARKEHPFFGYRRLADHLGVNHKRVFRVVQKFGLQLPKRKRSRLTALPPEVTMPVANLMVGRCALRAGAIWVADFTELVYRGKKLYLATVVDALTREVVGTSVQLRHTKELVLAALQTAVSNTGLVPELVHSDQGSEYLCHEVLMVLHENGITPSFSAKSSPWQNGKQEAFFSRFKAELIDLNQFPTLGDVVAHLHSSITYYNTERIHTALRMPPRTFKQALDSQTNGRFIGSTAVYRKRGH